MKKFLKKRWHGIPVGLIAMFLLAGVVAASTFWVISGTLEVEVKEPITAQYSIFGTWTDVPDGFEMVVGPYYAGETDIGYYRIYNAASVDIPVTVRLEDVPSDWTIGGATYLGGGVWRWTGTAPAGTFVEFNLTLEIPANAAPDTYTFLFRLGRA